MAQYKICVQITECNPNVNGGIPKLRGIKIKEGWMEVAFTICKPTKIAILLTVVQK